MASEGAEVMTALVCGIDAVTSWADAADPQARTPCNDWSVHDLVRHLEAIAGAYLLWAGSAVGGRLATIRVGQELAEYNEKMLQRLPQLDTAMHVVRYRHLADDHARLARSTWRQPMVRTPDGVVLSVGQHVGVAAIEWHVHAWDLATATGGAHRPDDLSLAVCRQTWDDILADVTGLTIETSDDPWTDLLVAAGRTP